MIMETGSGPGMADMHFSHLYFSSRLPTSTIIPGMGGTTITGIKNPILEKLKTAFKNTEPTALT